MSKIIKQQSKDCQTCMRFDKFCKKPKLKCWTGEGKERKYFIYKLKEDK